MSIISSLTGNARDWIFENPAQFSSFVLFSLGFSLVAANALVSQPGDHPAPFWQNTGKTEIRLGSAEPSPSTNLPTRAVLTQRISLANIPVPTASPVKTGRIAAQSTLVREVQSILAEVGVYKGRVDGIFGDETRQAIVDYQKTAGIIPDGEASYGLLANIKSAFAVARVNGRIETPATSIQTAQPGLIVLDSKTIQAVQSGLRDIYGEEEIAVDGIFGNQTRNAIRQFQKRFRLQVTGEIDEETLDKLREAGIIGAT